ncbi:ABC-type branched-subunit amino acid transport system substrate-binding protein [Amycolatopsis bartoniae]|uniref:ABC transporter substrate-binding protein n=1 Tax=Amycolatopsis bartoniae TaxID=941986 RepID=A0A8H9IPM9_9PSEU|nr:ABC transporter substrate-binding protein [Amycolatopsis bartoniae]MBB2938322.1 ABC-type branched-subunit amino acid transport system substrate-binding protein [Amycolatopsis bartoniae]TVT01786.1 ABC transporter substrate-binding protein [Amycolatopsis bartoniae]GHF34319.1 ABC transporter substrate-binding protein [Amycolatopsis bartoniae]
MAPSRQVRAGIALTAALALTLSGCAGGGGGGGSTPGVTDNSVTIGSTLPLTGTAAPGYSEQGPAAKAFFDYVNANGGINGRQISYKYLDDGYNPAQTVTLTKQLVLQDNVFAILGALGTPTHTKVVDFLNSSRVPDLFVASGCTCWDNPKDHPYTYGWQPDYTVEGKILGDYVKKNLAGKKVAYFYQDDDFGRDGMKGLDKFIDPNQVVSRQPYQPGNTDVAAQVSAIARSQADVVVLETIPAYTALFKLTALRLGYKPTLLASSVGADPITVSGLLENFAKQSGASVKGSDLIEGLVTSAYLPALDDTANSWTALFRKIHDQYIPNIPFDGNVYYAMSYAYTFVQALQAAGRNLTRQGLLDVLNKGGLRGPGLVPFRYGPDSHAGFTGGQIAIVQGGRQTGQGTPLTTDDGDGPVVPFTEAQPTAPANGIPAP